MRMFALQLVTVLVGAVAVQQTAGHGMLLEPPNRSSMWRFGFNTPPNYNDNENFCGGYVASNGGKCGVCGDKWTDPRPRANENGGKYGLGVIAKTYKSGEMMQTSARLTMNHWGSFEYRLCVLDRPDGLETDECFDQHLLTLADGTTRYELKTHESGDFPVAVQLPKGLTCKQCVLQWHYKTANTWGTCEDGHEAVGCGPQETFRSCTDITIE